MSQNEENVRAEAKAALAVAWKAMKPFLSKMEGKDRGLFLLIGRLYENAGSIPLKKINEVLAQARAKLGSYGIQTVGEQVINLLDKALESTGAIVFVQDALGEGAEKKATP